LISQLNFFKMTTENKSLLFEIPKLEGSRSNPRLLRVIVTSTFTRIDFGYTTPWYYESGGWIKIAAKTHLVVSGNEKKFLLKDTEGIPIAPKKMNFESTEDWQFFSLFFEPIPLIDCELSIIEKENPTEKDFNYYSIQLLLSEGLTILG